MRKLLKFLVIVLRAALAGWVLTIRMAMREPLSGTIEVDEVHVGPRFGGRIEFRMWHRDDQSVWDKHQWLSLEVIQQAAAMFKAMGKESDPTALYDVAVAERLLNEE